MSKFTCRNKDCVAFEQTFEWDNVDAPVCRSCEHPMAIDKAAKALKAKPEADDE